MSRNAASKRKATQAASVDEPVAPEDEKHEPKRARVDPDSPSATAMPDALQETAVAIPTPPPAAVKSQGQFGRLARVLGPPREKTAVPIPIDVMLKGLDPTRVPAKTIYKMQDRWYTLLMHAFEHHPGYFENKGILSSPVELTLKDNQQNSAIPFKSGSLTRGGPLIRSCIFVKAYSASITPGVGAARKERYGKKPVADDKKKEGGGDEGTSYYLDTLKLRGDNEIAKKQSDFLMFLRTELATFCMLLMCKEKDIQFKPRDKVFSTLLNDEEAGWKGKYKSLDDVPRDNEDLAKLRDAWMRGLPNPSMIVMKQELALGDQCPAFSFTRSATDWNNKRHWIPMPVSIMYVGPDFQVETETVTDEATIVKLVETAPYGVDFKLKPTFAKKELYIKYALAMERIIFFPQLAFMTEHLANGVEQMQSEFTPDDFAMMDEVVNNYKAQMAITETNKTALALTNKDMTPDGFRCNTSALALD